MGHVAWYFDRQPMQQLKVGSLSSLGRTPHLILEAARTMTPPTQCTTSRPQFIPSSLCCSLVSLVAVGTLPGVAGLAAPLTGACVYTMPAAIPADYDDGLVEKRVELFVTENLEG